MLFGLVTLVTTGFKDTYVRNGKVQLETLKKCAHNFLNIILLIHITKEFEMN